MRRIENLTDSVQDNTFIGTQTITDLIVLKNTRVRVVSRVDDIQRYGGREVRGGVQLVSIL